MYHEDVTEFCGVKTERKRWLGWNFALLKTRRERLKLAKLAKLANFNPAKMPETMELCQLDQHLFRGCKSNEIGLCMKSEE